MALFPCPCCGYHTLAEERRWEICPICFWEDDPLQYDEPSYAGGANQEALERADATSRCLGRQSVGISLPSVHQSQMTREASLVTTDPPYVCTGVGKIMEPR